MHLASLLRRLLAGLADFLGSALAALVALPFANWGYRAAAGDPPGGLYGGLVLGLIVYAIVYVAVARRTARLASRSALAIAACVGAVASVVLPGDPPGGLDGRLVFGAIMAAGAFFMIGPRLRRPSRVVAAVESVVAATVVVVGVPLLVALVNKPSPVPSAQPVATRFDVALVEASLPLPSDSSMLPPRPDSPLWDSRYWVYRRTPDGNLRLVAAKARAGTRDLGIVYGRTKPTAPVAPGWGRPGAARAIVLDVDRMPAIANDARALPAVAGTPGEVSRWRRLIAPITRAHVPVFALLRSSDRGRLARWRAWTARTGGDAVDVRRESQILLESALRVATLSPTLETDAALAWRFRPMLYFDRREQFAIPQDIEALFQQGSVEVCTHGLVRDASCTRPTDSLALGKSFSYLRILVSRPTRQPGGVVPTPPGGPGPPPSSPPSAPSPSDTAAPPSPPTPPGPPGPPTPPGPPGPPGPPPVAGGPTSVYYFHVTRPTSGSAVYVDYWWYLPYNDSPLTPHGLCAAGFEIPGVTCFDHQSDWEGITVVLERTNCRTSRCPLGPVRVQYAQHAHVVAYAWNYLVRKWGSRRRGFHPLVYSARGSHASYPDRCDVDCWQLAVHLPDGSRDGKKPWPNNSDSPKTGCAGLCLKPLPVRKGGRQPALWNAFTGHWGSQHCILRGAICDVGTAPESPGIQDRYLHPEKYDKLVTHD